MNADDYALVIGVDNYPRYRPLKGAVQDAKDFVKWLCNEPDGGGVPPDNCKPVYSTSNPLTPLQEQIDEAFDAIFSSIPRGKLARRLYVYFSGHGMAPTNLETHLCLANWAERFPNRALDSKEYLDAVMNLGKFAEVIMLFDCCRVRLVSAHGHPPDFLVAAPGPGAPQARYFTAYATEFLNSAYEAATAPPGSNQDPLVRGYFTRALMAALRGAAASTGGGVLASQLKKYLEDTTPKLALADGYVQKPEIVNGLNGDPAFGSALPTPAVPPPGTVQPTAAASAKGGLVPQRFTLTLHDPLGVKFVTVLDHHNKSIFRGTVGRKKKLSLQPGFFKVRTEFAQTILETPVELDQDLQVSTIEQVQAAPMPANSTLQGYTAAPLVNRATSHEYYTETSKRWSREPTRNSLPGPSDSSLFIFIRAVDREKHDPKSDLGKHLVLLDSRGDHISDFSASVTQRDNEFGWLAFHVKAPSNSYCLRFTGDPEREVTLQVYPGWQTQLFLMYRGQPLFETMKIFMGRDRQGFEPSYDENQAADVALDGLQNNQDLLSQQFLLRLLHGKFLNPVLGLVGAHIVLRRQKLIAARLVLERRKPNRAEQQQQQQNRNFIKPVLANLNNLLPGSPDVAALNLLAAPDLRSSASAQRFNQPPMLRPGLQAVLVEAAKHPDTITEDSPIPQIASRLYADTPWSTWKPLATAKGGAALDWVHIAILDLVKKETKQGKGTRKKKPITLSQFAEGLGLPQQTVMRAAKDLDTTSTASLRRAVPPEYKSLINPSSGRSRNKKPQPPSGILSATLREIAGLPIIGPRKEGSGETTSKSRKQRPHSPTVEARLQSIAERLDSIGAASSSKARAGVAMRGARRPAAAKF